MAKQEDITAAAKHFYGEIQVEDRNKALSGDTGIVDHHFGVGEVDLTDLERMTDDQIMATIRRLEENQATRLIGCMGGVRSDDVVLDAGSGRGGTAFRLVQASGCRVEGITIARYQADFATEAAGRLGLADKTHFSVMDMLALGYADNTFDHVFTNETTMYVVDLHELFAGFRRVLKPGGRYTLATWNINQDYGDNPYVEPINDHYRVGMHTDLEYREALGMNGFRIVTDVDLTKQVIPHWEIRSRWSMASGVEEYYLSGHKDRAILYKMMCAEAVK